jgi:hypothetical protein
MESGRGILEDLVRAGELTGNLVPSPVHLNMRKRHFYRWTRAICAVSLVGAGMAVSLGAEEPSLRARVLVAEAPGATVRFAPQLSVLTNLVARGVQGLTGQADAGSAWRSLVATQDTVGIKVFSRPGAISGTRPPVVEAVVQGLLASGLPPTNIVIWDRHLADLRFAGFLDLARRYGLRVAGSAESGYDEGTFYETALLGQLTYGDVEFGRSGPQIGRRSFASKALTTGVKRIISIAPLLNNNQTGISGHCWGLAVASVDNTLRFESTPGRLAEAVPEILALEGLDLRDRTVLAITDAMLCQYEGEERQLLHYSTVLDQLWFGTDPVALDVLGIHEIERQRAAANLAGAKPVFDTYENCSILELGVSSTNLMDITRLTLSGR